MTGILKAGASAFALAMSSLSVQAGDLDGLVQGDAAVNGVRLHYAVIGEGEPVLLLHGWPESLIAWRQVMPLLAKSGRRVWAIDLRGFGDSDKPASGYELDNVARDVHEFIRSQHLSTAQAGVDVVAHDIGSWVGHALAADYPADVRRRVLSEALLPRSPRRRPAFPTKPPTCARGTLPSIAWKTCPSCSCKAVSASTWPFSSRPRPSGAGGSTARRSTSMSDSSLCQARHVPASRTTG